MIIDDGILTHIHNGDIETIPMPEPSGWITEAMEWLETELDRITIIPKELLK